jgi:hypothetical protein
MFLSKEELPVYYPRAENMDANDLVLYLQRANAHAYGQIGGMPPFSDALTQDNLKIAIALAFEVFARDETAQVDSYTGNITEAAPETFFTRGKDKPLETVNLMLAPYAKAYEKSQQQSGNTDRGFMFL